MMKSNVKKMDWIAIGITLMLAVTTAQASTVHTPDSDTVLLWHLDEPAFGANPNAQDASGNNIRGSVFDINTTVLSGAIGVTGQPSDKAYHFTGHASGSRNLIRSDSTSSQWNSGAFTIEMWFKIANFNSFTAVDSTLGSVLAMQKDNAKIAWSLGFNNMTAGGGSTAFTTFRFFENSGPSPTPTENVTSFDSASIAIVKDVWHYVAMTSTPADINGLESHYDIYLAQQGASHLTHVSSFTGGQAGGLAPEATDQFYLGGDVNVAAPRAFDGLVDEVHYSSVARTEAYLTSSLTIPEPGTMVLLAASGVLMMFKRKFSAS